MIVSLFKHSWYLQDKTIILFDETERDCELILDNIDIVGEDIFLIHQFSKNINGELWQLVTVSKKLINNKNNICLIIPYFPYSRNHVFFKTILEYILSLGIKTIITIDLHCKIKHEKLISISPSQLFIPEILKRFHKENTIIVSPDKGAYRKAADIANICGMDCICLDKKRTEKKVLSVKLPYSIQKAYKTAVIIDDIVSSGQTLIQSKEILNKNGINEIAGFVTHNLKPNILSDLKWVITTNSLFIDENNDFIDLSNLINTLLKINFFSKNLLV